MLRFLPCLKGEFGKKGMDSLGRRKRRTFFARKWMGRSLFIYILLTLPCILVILFPFGFLERAALSASESSRSSKRGITAAMEEKCMNLIQSSIKEYEDIYSLDPLFVLAVIKAESHFRKYTISSVGAAGVAQFMPVTAKGMGMKVFLPSYYTAAWQELKIAGRYYREAEEIVAKISFKESEEYNRKQALEMIPYRKLATQHREKANRLFQRYKEELLAQVEDASDEELMEIDQRFIISIAVDVCVKLLADNAMRLERPDAREIASAYNAGLGRVLEFQGIPFIEETVTFQNRVINYYREYLSRSSFDSSSSQFSKEDSVGFDLDVAIDIMNPREWGRN